MTIKWILKMLEDFSGASQPKYCRFTSDQLLTIQLRTSRALKLLRRRWSVRLCEEDETEIILRLDQLYKRLERKAFAAKRNSELHAESILKDLADQVASAAGSCCLADGIERRYPRSEDI